ncbi:YcxB family protein [Actinophytocola oryzae]|uniref:YcxB-like protein n=1 Tax=Actinophytocola oryzae TaxID=502181 RepID=A0A4R7V420_9PSEU|nr:YcxB family protein [Actinophytocola oryzae]TDV42655.1 YcxB-like protein [Actinophytocola oryzae]
MALELRWDPAPSDWNDALRAVYPTYRFAPWFGLGLGVLAIVLLVAGQPLPGSFGVLAAMVIAALPMVAVWLQFRRNPVAASTVTATVDDRSFRMMTVDGTAYTDLRWSAMDGWVETRHNFVLRTGGTSLFPVPGRAFGEQGDLDGFRDLLRAQLGEPARR